MSASTKKNIIGLLSAMLAISLVVGMMPSLAWAQEGSSPANAAVALEDEGAGEGEGATEPDPDPVASLLYKTYKTTWGSYKADGVTSGSSTGTNTVKAIVVKKTAETNVDGGLEVSVNMRGKGWCSNVGNAQVAGDKKTKVQAIRIGLTGDLADMYDVYYRVSVPGYGWMGWSCNGQTSGTLSLKRTIRGVQVKLVEKGAEAPGSTEMRYASLETNLDSFAKVVLKNKIKNTSSSTRWIIVTNCTFNRTAIYKGSKGKWVLSKFYVCSCGKPSTPTRKGTYTVKDRGKYFNGVDKGDPYTCWYWTQYSGNYLYHSVVYKRGSSTKILDGTLGKNVSHGCVRLAIDNAKWIYTNVPRGTKCVLY